jgi:peptidoglycan/LPS O-acetylase OafA/YrhL
MRYKPFGTFRTVLAILVLVQHIGHVGPASVKWLGNLGTGSVAVLVFFCLSGFVITEAADQLYKGRPVGFALNRVLRIVPQYWIALAASAGMIAIAARSQPNFLPNPLVPHALWELFDPQNIVVNLFMIIPGFAAKNPPFVPYVWALRVEILFYGVVFLALMVSMRSWVIARAFLVVSAVAMFVAAVSRTGPDLFQFVPYFVLGAVTYGTLQHPSRSGYGLVTVLFAVCLWTCATLSMPSAFIGRFLTFEQRTIQIGIFAVLMLGFFVLTQMRLPVYWRRIDRRIGDLSFPLYLQQYVALVFTLAFFPASYGSMVVCASLAFTWAWCSNAITEAPIRALRDRIRGRSISDVATTQPDELHESGRASPDRAMASPLTGAEVRVS